MSDFAQNENKSDALISLAMIFRFGEWKNGKYLDRVKKILRDIFPKSKVALFLTGRAAIYNVLRSLHIKKGSHVLVQGLTCSSVVLPIIGNGLKPLYADIESETHSLKIEKVNENMRFKPKVIILQHMFGDVPKDREQILKLAYSHDIVVIEDLAHSSNFDFYKKQAMSSTKNFFVLSFGVTKTFSSVVGGAVLAGSQSNFEALKKLESKLRFPSNFFIFKSLLYKPWIYLVKSTNNSFFKKLVSKIGRSLKLFITDPTGVEREGRFDDFFNKKYPNALALLLINQLKKNKKSGNNFLKSLFNSVIIPKEIDTDLFRYKQGSCPTAEKVARSLRSQDL